MGRNLRIAGLVSLAAAGLWRVIHVGVVEYYSASWTATSSVDAEARGILLERLHVSPRQLSYRGDTLMIEDAWVERLTRTEYRWFLVRREVVQPGSRLVLRASGDWRPNDFSCDDGLTYADTVQLAQSGGRYFFDQPYQTTESSFQGTLRLGVLRRKNCVPLAATNGSS